MHVYNEDFYQYQSKGSYESAKVVVDILKDYIQLESVLDVGCGVGPWLKVYQDHGAQITGIDGDYINENQLLIDGNSFFSADLKEAINLKKRFTLAQSLEVAEHIPENCAANFVQTLVNHSDCILFSAAVPGQGGEDHINEQPLEYWRKKFTDKGYEAFDIVRPALQKRDDKASVEKWYQYNSVVYINRESALFADPKLQAFKVPNNQALENYSDVMWTLRKALVKNLPNSVATAIAKLKAKLIAFKNK